MFYMPRSVFALHTDSAEQLNRPTIVVGVLELFLSGSSLLIFFIGR